MSAGTAATDFTIRNPGSGSGGIALNGALNVASNRLTLNSAGAVTQSAALTAGSLQLLGTGGTYTLTNTGNAVGTVGANTGTVDFVHAGALTIGSVNGTTGATVTGDFSAAVAASGGTLTLTSGAAIATGGTGTVTLSADAMNVGGTISSASGIVALRPRNAGRLVSLGSEDASSLSLTDAELDKITAGTLRLGSSDAGALTFTAALTLNVGGALGQTAALTGVNRLELTATSAVDLDVDGVSNTITTLGAVTRSGAFERADSAGGLTLDGVVSAAAAGLSIRTTGDLTLTANATVAASGAADIVLAAQDGKFINNRGSDAVSLWTGRFLIYADTRDGSTMSAAPEAANTPAATPTIRRPA